MATYTETIDLEDGVSDVANEAKASVLGLSDSMGGLSKTLGDTTEAGGGLQAELAEMTGGLSIVAEAAGIAALALGAIVAAGAVLALKFNEADKAMTATFEALGHGKTSGAETVAMLDDLGASIGQTRAKLAPLTQQFALMGITGVDQLRSLTLAAASANATVAGAGDTFTAMYKKLTAAADLGQPFKVAAKGAGSLLSMGLDIDDMAKRMGMTATQLGTQLKNGLDPATARKFGTAMQDALIKQGAGPLAALGNSMGSIKDAFMENIGKMFKDAGPAVDGFMAAVKDLFDIFGQGKSSGQAMSAGIGGFFKELFSLATKVVPYVKHFLLDLVIYGLKAYIALKPIAKYLTELWKQHDGLGLLKKAFMAVGLVVALLAVAVLVMLAPFIAAGVIFVALVAGLVALGVAFSELSTYITGALTAAGAALGEWVSSAADTAKNFIMGLVNGISNGASLVVDAVKGLAKGAMDSITGALGIHSPSTVMMKLGGHTAGGFAEGIDAGAGEVAGAASGLATATAKGAASGPSGAPGAPGPGGSSSGGGIVVNVEPGAIVIQGGGQSAVELTEEAVSMIFERVALGAGL